MDYNTYVQGMHDNLEKNMIGCLLWNPEIIETALQAGVTPDHFAIKKYRDAYCVILFMHMIDEDFCIETFAEFWQERLNCNADTLSESHNLRNNYQVYFGHLGELLEGFAYRGKVRKVRKLKKSTDDQQ